MQHRYIYQMQGTWQNSVGHWSRHLRPGAVGLGVFQRPAPSVRRRLISARCLALAAQCLLLGVQRPSRSVQCRPPTD